MTHSWKMPAIAGFVCTLVAAGAFFWKTRCNDSGFLTQHPIYFCPGGVKIQVLQFVFLAFSFLSLVFFALSLRAKLTE